MHSAYLLTLAALAITAPRAAHADAAYCNQVAGYAYKQRSEAIKLFDKVTAMQPAAGAFASAKTFSDYDKLIEQRKPAWTAFRAEAEKLVAQVKLARSKLYQAEYVCKEFNQQKQAKQLKSYINMLIQPNIGLQDKSRKLLELGKCGEGAEGADILSSVISGTYEAYGTSAQLYQTALKYGFHKPKELEQTIRKACDGNPSLDKVRARLAPIEAGAIYPYYVFVVQPIAKIIPAELEMYKSEFVRYLIKDAALGRVNTVINMLARGQYKFSLETGRADDGVTLFMAVASSGKVDLLRTIADFAKNNADRGALGVNKQDRKGQTALHHCALSSRCTPEMIKALLDAYKVDKGMKNKEGKTALDLALANKRAELVTALGGNGNSVEFPVVKCGAIFGKLVGTCVPITSGSKEDEIAETFFQAIGICREGDDMVYLSVIGGTGGESEEYIYENEPMNVEVKGKKTAGGMSYQTQEDEDISLVFRVLKNSAELEVVTKTGEQTAMYVCDRY